MVTQLEDDQRVFDGNGDVWRYLPLAPLPTLVVGIVGLGLLVTVGMRSSTGTRRLAVVLLFLSLLSVLAVTLGGRGVQVRPGVNLHLGAGIRSELGNVNNALGLVNVLGNIALFVPLGWLIAVLVLHSPVARVWVGLGRGALVGFGLSLTIEVLQYFLGRAVDIDDVLLNTAGAVLGAAVGTALSAARRAISDRAAERPPRVEPLNPPI